MTPPNAPGTGTARRNRDSEIIDAAITVFSQRGYSAASLKEIADRVGILKGSLYHYIESKESLLFRILQGSHEAAQQIMDEVDALDLPCEAKFVTYVQRMSLWYLHNLERASLYFSEWRYLAGENAATVRTQRRDLTAYLSQLIENAADQGLTRPGLDVDLANRFILSAINSIPSWYRTAPPKRLTHVARELAELARSAVFVSSA